MNFLHEPTDVSGDEVFKGYIEALVVFAVDCDAAFWSA